VIYESGEGFPVVYHHGTPAIGELYPAWHGDGVRLIGFDRSGYGDAPRRHGRSVADVVEEVVELVDSLAIDRFATWGISGGGPHALACAALLPDRVVAAAALASPAPFAAEGLDWFEGEGELNEVEFNAALQGETAVRPLLEQWHGAMNAGGAEGVRDGMASLLSEVDAATLDGGLAEFLHRGIVETGGVDGWLDDDLAFVKDWGFDLESIEVPVLIRQGEQDRFVPAAHGRWLAEHIPGSEPRITPDDGHLTLYERAVPGVHAWLLQESRSDNRRR
jgi:pimeloyl-ACP methyl ester carboxylesterase